MAWKAPMWAGEGGNKEEDEVHQETNHLHLLTTVEFIVDQKGCRFVSEMMRV